MQQKKYFYLLAAYVAILHIAAILNLFGFLPGGKPAFVVDIATAIPFALTLRYWSPSRGYQRKTILDIAVTGYLLISILSLVLYYQPNNPSLPEAYIYGIHYFVLPIFLYYAVKTINISQQASLLFLLVFLNLLLFTVGIYLFYARPEFYNAYLINVAFAAKGHLSKWQVYSRMQSYLGSTSIGIIAAITIILSVLLRIKDKFLFIILPISMFGAILSFQRGGMLASSIALFYALLRVRGSILLKILLSSFLVGIIAISAYQFTDVERQTITRLQDRYSTESYTDLKLEDRGYLPGLSYFNDFPLGVGLGGTSSGADSAGLARRGQVVDANFMRILADLGIVGILSFLSVLWFAGESAMRKENGWGWLLIIGLICGVCLGTNILDSYYVSHCFWLLLGVIDTPSQKSASNNPFHRIPGGVAI
jgi:hypothetical protein